MKRYNLIKNIVISSLAAIIFHGYVVPSVPILREIVAVLGAFVITMILLREMDKSLIRKKQEMKKSASVGKP